MSRSGYCDRSDDEGAQWAHIRWRGAVASAIRGKRGQAFLNELADALDAMPDKRLIAEELQADGQFCAIGTVGAARGIDVSKIDAWDGREVAEAFGIPRALVLEIEFMNDDDHGDSGDDPDDCVARWRRVRRWVDEQIKQEKSSNG